MSGLVFDAARCVRTVTKFSECSHCVDICPVETMHIAENGLPAFTPSVCVDCGGCIGVCPSEALSLRDYDTTEFFFEFVQSEENLISCRKNVPCIMALSVEHLISLALVKPEAMVLDIGHCQTCPWREPLYGAILENAEEANYILDAMESGKKVVVRNVAYEEKGVDEKIDVHDRRAFLERLSLKGALKTKKAFDEAVEAVSDETRMHDVDLVAVAKIRQKELPDKRKIFFTALKRTSKPKVYHTIAEESISFASQKFIDMETCTACQMCYRICPTGALSSDARNSRIYFDAMMCVKCRACHDTCEPDSLKLQPTFELKEFFEPTQRLLASFRLVRCDECGIHFPSVRGERTCPRCAVEEEEALDLWGLEEKDGVVVFREEEKKDE
ncbi:4Fe-4S binding protein [Hydrogenimonas sp.]|uniref:4Fe-4S binding protein n=1 Tax=Hydrogenimonas sp. TaxID=2231112 RepID=UPI002637C7E6|nr:4Fe-4S binding protein [Hydrogenimonas sp.]